MSLVKSFTHLKGRPKEEQALPILQRIASLVKPIMRNHDWNLPVLAEFFPDNESLVGSYVLYDALPSLVHFLRTGMNVNGGQKIFLRLRPAWAPDTFYDEEQLVLVMLHELTHNVHGPHDSKFYALLAKLEQEYEDLKRSGYAGEGFHSVGARLGIGVSHDLPPHLAKLKALEAAEKRRKATVVMSGGGRLGGRTNGRNRSPRELAAEAAERRARDEKSCGSGHGADAEVEARRAAQDSVIDVIDVDAPPDVGRRKRDPSPEIIVLDGPSTPPRKNKAEPSQKKRIVTAAASASLRERPTSASRLRSAVSKPSVPIPPSGEWSCPTCTLFNTPLVLQCAACFSSRPPDPDAGWTCLSCGEYGMPHDFWTCRVCGKVKREN